MYHLAESLRIVSILIQPFLTQAPFKIWKQLGIEAGELTASESAAAFGTLPAGTQLLKGDPIFPRLDVELEVSYIADVMKGGAAKEAETPKLVEAKPTNPSTSTEMETVKQAEEISIDDFFKVELRVAQVIAAEPLKNADKLLKLQLDLGTEQRQVVSGIAKFYTPEQMVGRKVICVTNLKPVKLRGEWSQGMILAASHGDQLTLATVAEDLPNGAIVK
jgi:methionyl-tRNA synthetase